MLADAIRQFDIWAAAHPTAASLLLVWAAFWFLLGPPWKS